MARHYSASSFFRQIPNDLLARCCESQGLGSELDFAGCVPPWNAKRGNVMVYSKRPPPCRWRLWAGHARPKRCGKPSGELAAPRGFPHLRQDPRASLLRRLRLLPLPLGQVTRPLVHQCPPAFKQVRAGVGRLDPVLDHMRQGRLDHLSGMIRLLTNSVKVFTGI